MSAKIWYFIRRKRRTITKILLSIKWYIVGYFSHFNWVDSNGKRCSKYKLPMAKLEAFIIIYVHNKNINEYFIHD